MADLSPDDVRRAGDRPVEQRVLDAAKTCSERWGMAKVTIDDIAGEAGVSRATLYRLFPGGKDVLFEALRVRELELYFARLAEQLDGAIDLERLIVPLRDRATHETLWRALAGGDTPASRIRDRGRSACARGDGNAGRRRRCSRRAWWWRR